MGGGLALHMLRKKSEGLLPDEVKGIFSIGSFVINKSVLFSPSSIIDESNEFVRSTRTNDIPVLMMHGKSYIW